MPADKIIEIVIAAITMGAAVYAVIIARGEKAKKETDDRFKAQGADISKVDTRVGSVEVKVASVEAKGDFTYDAVMKSLAIQMHHPHNPRRDELIEKMTRDELTPEEAEEFKRLMKQISKNENEPPKDRHAAAMLYSMLESNWRNTSS